MVGPFGFRPKQTMRARALQLAQALTRRGHTVQLFMPPWETPEEADRHWDELGVGVRYVSLKGGVLPTIGRLIQETLAWQPDVVHCFKPKAYSGLVAEWLWHTHRHRLRLVMDTDDWEGWGGWNDREPYPRHYKWLFARQERWGMQHCHALTVASRALETLAWGHAVSPTRTVYLPNGSGIAYQNVTAQPHLAKQLLIYSRFFEFDVARLVTILQRCHTQLPDWKVLVVGTSLHAEDGARFAQLLDQAELRHWVDDVGWIDQSELPDLLAQSAIGLYLMDDDLLNRTKCPVKVADLSALGLPIVGERVGQLPEYILHGQSGLLYQSGDVEGIVSGILQLAQQPPLREAFGRCARQQFIEKFSWDQLAISAENAYYSKQK